MKINHEIDKYIKFQRTGVKNISEYGKSIHADFESIKNYLPSTCSNVLDIGCGMAGIDILLYKHFKCNVHLVDKDGISESLHYGYQQEAAHYNLLQLTTDFLTLNGVSSGKIFTYDVNKKEFPSHKCQVIISLISCGFHYPVSTYLDQIKKLQAGIVILDIRKGTDQFQLLKDSFKTVKTIE